MNESVNIKFAYCSVILHFAVAFGSLFSKEREFAVFMPRIVDYGFHFNSFLRQL